MFMLKRVKPKIHEDEGEHEGGNGEPDEADEGRDVVAHRVLADGRVDADGQGERPR